MAAFGDDPPKPRPKAARADVSKYLVVEPPAEKVVAALSATAPATDNPKVQPGLVRWHATFADACGAAGRSGKPVLLFQMMGKLDDQFC
jgi:hypothetical protein